MTREEFDALVDRLEQRFRARPLALRVRVALMVGLGYAGFLFWFLLLFLVGAAFFVGGVAIDTAPGLVLLVLGSLLLTVGGIQAAELLWVRLEMPPGREIGPQEAPRLFEVLGRLRKTLRSARFNQVRITAEFNASAGQMPRLGVFGWSRSFLTLGLPLLEALSADEVEAVLAHEFAHLSGRHGRFGAWIYRLRRTWERVFERLHQRTTSSSGRAVRVFFLKFVDRYWPRFNAYAFVLSRTNEYAADQFAGQWAGRRQFALALWRIECLGRRLEEELWPALWQLANTEPHPPSDLVERLLAALAEPSSPAEAQRWLERAVHALTDHLDTHPSLSDRLRALGQSVEEFRKAGYPEPARPSAASVFLGEGLAEVRKEVGLLWQQEVAETWRNRHGRAASLQRKLATLAQVPRDSESDPDLLWDKARAVLDLDGPDAAEPLLRRLLELRPTHSAANLVLGQHLLEQGQPEGECLLRRILETDEDELIPPACESLARHFQTAGLTDRLQEVRRQLSRYETAVAAAGRERNSVSASDRFLTHDLEEAEMAALHEVLAQQTDLACAYLARKELKHFPRQRLFVCCVRSTASCWTWSGADRDSALAARLIPVVRLPGRVLIIAARGNFRALSRKIMAMPDARVYPTKKLSERVPLLPGEGVLR
jgi:Zn-dependent protease with chaperone function